MKKITFILVALISGTAFAQESATASVKAEIVSPLVISSEGELNFGKLQNVAGTVKVIPGSTTAEYSVEGLKVTGGTISYPTFTVVAESAYQITLPEDVDLTTTSAKVGPKAMSLEDFKTNLASTSGVTAGGFWLGATLNVLDGQAPGIYEGTVEVTVSYE